LIHKNSTPINQNEFLSPILKRNEVNIKELLGVCDPVDSPLLNKIKADEEVLNQIEIGIKYDGYIKRQADQIEHFNKNEDIRIPEDFKYDKINSLSSEAKDKLKKIKPLSLGQATRIAGVRPSDISAILIYMRG
jgi:tRNA uridine 5-carboxymethylaminomethyl modification enzyme